MNIEPITFQLEQKNKKYLVWNWNTRNNDYILTAHSYIFGNFLVDFLSLDIQKLCNSLLQLFSSENWNSNQIYQIINNECNKVMALLFTQKIYNSLNITKGDYDRTLKSFSDSFSGIQEEIAIFLETSQIEDGGYIDLMVSGLMQKTTATFRYDKLFGFYITYELSDIDSLLSLEIINIQDSSITINQCKNCKKYFIPEKRSDEIYCDRIFKNHKTCKEVGYSNKIKNDLFKTEYRKAYKTQHAKIKRYSENIPNYKEKYFVPWKKALKETMNKYQSSNDIDSFRKWIDENPPIS